MHIVWSILIPCILFFFLNYNLLKCICTFVCAQAYIFVFKALNTETLFSDCPIITTWDCLFDYFQRVSAKSLFCDYHLIICPPKCLSSTISRFFSPGLSGGQAFDWQLVNDVISMLLGKSSSSNSRLVREKGMIICYAWCVPDDGWPGDARTEELSDYPETEGKRRGEQE